MITGKNTKVATPKVEKNKKTETKEKTEQTEKKNSETTTKKEVKKETSSKTSNKTAASSTKSTETSKKQGDAQGNAAIGNLIKPEKQHKVHKGIAPIIQETLATPWVATAMAKAK
ncbi:hypothetical protein BPO_1249 [Bergeyella porcorum]|uniref:Uncharacterized protein n=1 Tax=Bergeyella porcorum TaxID=1735111 RepID=A0AAU0F7C5_9FLAO